MRRFLEKKLYSWYFHALKNIVNSEERNIRIAFGGRGQRMGLGCSSTSFHMKMTSYVAVHLPHNRGIWSILSKMVEFCKSSGLQAFVMEKKHSNESSGKGKKCFCEPILAVRITEETFQCHRWKNNLFSLQKIKV